MRAYLFTIIFVASLLTSASFAQNFGIKAGLNIASMVGVDETKNRNGLYLGIMGELPLSKAVFIESGLAYSSKGTKGKTDISCNVNANYIELPLLLKYKTTLSNGMKFYGSGGFYAAYGVGGKSEAYIETGENSFNKSEYDTFGDEFGTNRFDAGLSVAIGVQIKKIQIGAQYNYGLTNTGFGSNKQFLVGDSKNRNFNVSVAYLFKTR